MTVYLRVIEPVTVGDDIASVERLTWARLEWRIGVKSATRFERDGAQRQTLAVPTASIATWLLDNWWSLLYELSPTAVEGNVPDWRSLDADNGTWRDRHSVRAADSALCLPDLCIYSTGPAVTWSLCPDADNRRVRYLNEAMVSTARSQALESLGGLIRWTLDALLDDQSETARWLRARWTALQQSNLDRGQSEFCRAAGRLGLDPYDTSDWPEGLSEWMTMSPPGTLDSAFAVDLLGFGRDMADLPAVEQALRTFINHEHLVGHEVPAALRDGLDTSDSEPAFVLGYQRAERLRHDAKLAADAPVGDMAAVVHNAVGVVFRSANARIAAPVSAVAGWTGDICQVRVQNNDASNARRRFTLARGAYLAAWRGADGPRLAADAKDRDQQAARAFAAELLAPRKAVLQRVDSLRRTMPIEDALQQTATEYDVDSNVIARQVENARAGR